MKRRSSSHKKRSRTRKPSALSQLMTFLMKKVTRGQKLPNLKKNVKMVRKSFIFEMEILNLHFL